MLKKIRALFNFFLSNNAIPGKWCNAIVILIYKEGDTTELNANYLYRLFTRITNNYTARLLDKLYFFQPIEQGGFRSAFGINNYLQSIKTVIEKSIEYNNRSLALAFEDFHNAFDTVELDAVFTISKKGLNID